MLKKKLNSIPIKKKVAGILALFVFLFLGTFFSVSAILSSLENKLINLSDLHTLETSVFELNKDISEIQRLVLAYGRTGSEAIYRKLTFRHKSLQDRLLNLKKQDDFKEIEADISSLLAVTKRYEEDIVSLKELREKKDTSIGIGLPSAFEELEKTLTSTRLPERLKIRTQESIYRMRFYAKSFIAHKNFKSKRAFNVLSREVLKTLKKNGDDQLRDALKTYIEIFDQAIIANRNYITLVNVVMSGEATEFSNLSQKLNQKVALLTENTNNALQKKITDNQNVFYIAFLILLPIIFITIYFSNQTVTNSLKDIADTFESFLKGDFSQEVPERDRTDEIGKLANAAEEFKKLNKQLKNESKRAQGLAQTKSDFLANMSHEIRTPMNGIMGMVEHMLDTDLNKEQKEMLDIISSSGNSLTTILNDILDLSKIESGKMIFEKEPISLKKLVEEVEFLFQEKAKSKGVRLSSFIEKDITFNFFYGDLTRIKQILINLLSNAIKFTNKGSIELHIAGGPLKDGLSPLTFTVKDTGIGIPKDKQELIFAKFSQSDASTTRKFGGTGLGLAISKKLAELMGSQLLLESDLGKGANFSFTLLVQKAEVEKKAEDKKLLHFGKLGDSKNCLIVEDNEINVKVLTKRLDKLGLCYEVVNNGQEALDKEKEKNFDLIFMDLQMPVMDGLTAAKSLRDRGCETPIIAMTANVQESDQKMCKEAGMEYFIGKPIKRELLEDLLEYILIENKVS